MPVEAKRQYHVDTFTIPQRLNKTILFERLKGLVTKDFPMPDNWQDGYRYYRYSNSQRFKESLNMRMEVFDAIFHKGQTMKIPEFPYINRFQVGGFWKQNADWSVEKASTYNGAFLLERENYPLYRQYSYILVLPPIFNWIDRLLEGDHQNRDFENVLETWLYGRNYHFGRLGDKTVYLEEFHTYRLCFQLFLNYNPFRDRINPQKSLERDTLEYRERLQQWENLLNYYGPDGLTETQTALLPEPSETDDKGKWLIFADSIEEVDPDHPYLFFIRFFNTEPK